MKPEYWQLQDPAKPRYGDMLWSRPETRSQAGKLLVVGGSAAGFAAPAEAYALANKAGAGTIRVALPDSLRRTVGQIFEAGEYVPSTPSGSLAQTALAELLDLAHWSDAVLLAGDFGRNSETAILLESFLNKFTGQVTITGDAVEYLQGLPSLLDRPESLLVTDFSHLQKLFVAAASPTALTSRLDLLHVVEALHAFTVAHQCRILLLHDRTVLAAVDGQVSSTAFSIYNRPELPQLAAAGAVWQMQNPGKLFESLTTAVVAHIQG